MENPLFERSRIAFKNPYKNQGQNEEIESKNEKGAPKTLKKQ